MLGQGSQMVDGLGARHGGEVEREAWGLIQEWGRKVVKKSQLCVVL